MKKLNQGGFEPVFFIVVIALIGGLAFVAYRVTNAKPSAQTSATKTTSKISSKSDVTAAKKSLSDTSADKDLDPSQLSADLSALQ